MSRELFKSMTYKNGKVFTRQCSSNEYPKDFFSTENTTLTELYNKLGQRDFEKWFFVNCLMQGYVEIKRDCNKVLKRLSNLVFLLREDKSFQKLKDTSWNAFAGSVNAKTESEKEYARKKYEMTEKDIEEYISSFYDAHNSEY